MKQIYLIRHGAYKRDSGKLTIEGILEISNTGNAIKENLKDMNKIKIYHSPIIRAEQSAEVLECILHPMKSILESKEELSLENYKINNLVKTLDNDTYIIVSHQPDLEHYLRNMGKNTHLRTGDFRVI